MGTMTSHTISEDRRLRQNFRWPVCSVSEVEDLFLCCSAEDDTTAFRPFGEFLPSRQSKESSSAQENDERSFTPSSQSIGGADIVSLTATDKGSGSVNLSTTENADAFPPSAYHDLLTKIQKYDDEFARMSGEMQKLQRQLSEVQQTNTPRSSFEVSTQKECRISIAFSSGSSDVPYLAPKSSGSSDVPYLAPKSSVNSNRDDEMSESPPPPSAISLDFPPEINTRGEGEDLKAKPQPSKYVPIETPSNRIEKFLVYKEGPRDIGRIETWQPAQYDLKDDGTDFLKERTYVPKKKSTSGDKAVHKAGPREIGRITDWEPANYGIDLKKLSQEDFLKERTSTMRPLRHQMKRQKKNKGVAKELQPDYSIKSHVNTNNISKRKHSDQSSSHSDNASTRSNSSVSSMNKTNISSSQRERSSFKSDDLKSPSSDLECFGNESPTGPTKRKKLAPTLPPRPSPPHSDEGTRDPRGMHAPMPHRHNPTSPFFIPPPPPSTPPPPKRFPLMFQVVPDLQIVPGRSFDAWSILDV